MALRSLFATCFAALAFNAVLVVALAVWLLLRHLGSAATTAGLIYIGLAGLLLAAVSAIAWAYVDKTVATPLLAVLRAMQSAGVAGESSLAIADGYQLGELPAAAVQLIHRVIDAERRTDEAVAAATRDVEDQRNQLAAILKDLHEGVIVCTPDHRILLYNTLALKLLQVSGELGLGRSIFEVLARRPVEHAVGRLAQRLAAGRHLSHPDGMSMPFIGGTRDGRTLLTGRIGLIAGADTAASGYVLSVRDGTHELATLANRDRLLREATEGLRGALGNLKAAAEILAGGVSLDPPEDRRFRQAVLAESRCLSDFLERLTAQYREIVAGSWPMTDIYSSNLLQTVADRLQQRRRLTAEQVGLPHWLHGDSYTLVELLDRLCVRVAAYTGCKHVELAASGVDNLVYVDISWTGNPVPAAEIEGWLAEQLPADVAPLSLREVLERHRATLWSTGDRAGVAVLRLPLPPGIRSHETVVEPTETRPEFYDLALMSQPDVAADRLDQPLSALSYVVFDTETTGLSRRSGDEIVALAAVRIVNGRILTGECFERLINPQRPIPPASTQIHGIDNAMVRDKPPLTVVLPQFRDFIADSVLVAHNATFDLGFLETATVTGEVALDRPVLDTLLLSAYLHDHESDHALDLVAERFGVPLTARHNALGDAMITAAVFLKMVDLLAARGIVTLRQALAAANSMMQLRARQSAAERER